MKILKIISILLKEGYQGLIAGGQAKDIIKEKRLLAAVNLKKNKKIRIKHIIKV